jgi:FkbM family methyltransferase
MIDLGSSYGGWLVPGRLVEPDWVCYCVGAGGDISFDLELIHRYGATVRSFEPVGEYVARISEEAVGEPRFSVHEVAVAMNDGPLRMQVTHDLKSLSVSPAGLYESDRFVELQGRTLPSLMRELGDDRIDLLKVDIEGGEYELLPTIDLRALGVQVFSVQLHHTGSVRQARRLIKWLRESGYDPVGCRPAVKLTFVRRDVLPTIAS